MYGTNLVKTTFLKSIFKVHSNSSLIEIEEITSEEVDGNETNKEGSSRQSERLLKISSNSYGREFNKLNKRQEFALDKLSYVKTIHISGPAAIHISGPAGTGKTFLALQYVLLKKKTSFLKPNANKVLYICQTKELAFFFAKWIYSRTPIEKFSKALEKIQFLVLDNTEKKDHLSIQIYLDDKILKQKKGSFDYSKLGGTFHFLRRRKFGTIIVDEAHDVFCNKSESQIVKDILRKEKGATQIILSDMTHQSVSENQIDFPKVYGKLKLTDVTRSSKRIISGSMIYQEENTSSLRCKHEYVGSRLQTHIFAQYQSEFYRMTVYAEKIMEAIEDIKSNFENIDLHHRLGILVPDDDFCSSLKLVLCEVFDEGEKDCNFRIIDAITFSKCVDGRERSLRDESCIIVDTVQAMSGMEIMFVLGVGLDQPIVDRSNINFNARALIYKAITRAHLCFYFINERVEDGWLEWLQLIKPDKSDEVKCLEKTYFGIAGSSQIPERYKIKDEEQDNENKALSPVFTTAKSDVEKPKREPLFHPTKTNIKGTHFGRLTLIEEKCITEKISRLLTTDEQEIDIPSTSPEAHNELLKLKVARAAEEGGGLYPIWKGKIIVLGSDQPGKSSTLRSIIGNKYNAASHNTVSPDMSEANVSGIRQIEVNINDINFVYNHEVQKDVSKPWKEAKVKRYTSEYQSIKENIRNKAIVNNSEETLRRFEEIILQKHNQCSYSANIQESKKKKDSRKKINSNDGEEDSYIDKGEVGKISISIWNNSRQTAFRTIQNLSITRKCCYIVVFNLTDFLGDKNMKGKALDYLLFWMESIKHHGICSNKYKEVPDSSILYPPVILVGTHLDCIEKMATEKSKIFTIDGTAEAHADIVNEKLREINKILKNKLGSIGIFSTTSSTSSPNSVFIKDREYLYNSKQNLCFWPIDNSIDHEKSQSNIPLLRSIIMRSIMEDTLDYVNDPIPSKWLYAIDKLSEIASNKPILPLYDNNGDDKDAGDTAISSVVSILLKADALNSDSDQKNRAKVFMKYCHQIGLFVYYDGVPGLEDYCIINPQWLIDKITYVIRDVKFDRLPMDTYAMKLNGGRYWIDLRDKGILDLELLQEFWSDESDITFDYLIRLMIELRIFGMFATKIDGDTNTTKFIVPSFITSHTCAIDSMSRHNPFCPLQKIENYFSISWEDLCQWSISFSGFLPVECYNQLVASLVDNWTKGYLEADAPVLLPSAALLRMGPNHRYALVLDIQQSRFSSEENTNLSSSPLCSSIKVISCNEDEMIIMFHHIRSGLDVIIEKFHKSMLHYKVIDGKGNELEEEDYSFCASSQYRSIWSRFLSRYLSEDRNWSEHYSNEDKREARKKKAMEDMTFFFTGQGMSEEWSDRITKLMFKRKYPNDLTPTYLYELYKTEEDKEKFKEKTLKFVFGIAEPMDRYHVEIVLKKCDQPIDYMLGFISGHNLKELVLENKEIRKHLFVTNLKAEIFEENPADFFFDGTTKEYKVLHIATHGNSGKLILHNDSGSEISTKDILLAVTRICDGPEDCDGSIQCVVLNGCELEELAEKLHDAGVKYVLSWKTLVEDTAARTFASALYKCLGGRRDNMLKFKDAYEIAVHHLKLRGWLLEDPSKQELIANIQKEKMNPAVKAAGIPCIFTKEEKNMESIDGTEDCCLTHIIYILNDITSWPSDENNDLNVSIISDQFLDPEGSIQLSKSNEKMELKIICNAEKKPKPLLEGRIVYRYGLWRTKPVVFHLKGWDAMQRISLTTLDSNSKGNINEVQLMKSEGNNINDLPKEYSDLYSKGAYEFLITGCTMKENWKKIQDGGYTTELHNLFDVMPSQDPIFCYLFTGKGDTNPKNFAFARNDKAEAKEGELKMFAKNVRRMFTGLYKDVNETFKDNDKDFLQKLKDKQKKVHNEWTLHEYTTVKWLYNELPASGYYREVIFSTKFGSTLKKISQCKFPKFNHISGSWPLPNIAEQHGQSRKRPNTLSSLSSSQNQRKHQKRYCED